MYGKLMFNKYGVSVGEDENILEVDGVVVHSRLPKFNA
jgi:hypothetical protein